MIRNGEASNIRRIMDRRVDGVAIADNDNFMKRPYVGKKVIQRADTLDAEDKQEILGSMQKYIQTVANVKQASKFSPIPADSTPAFNSTGTPTAPPAPPDNTGTSLPDAPVPATTAVLYSVPPKNRGRKR